MENNIIEAYKINKTYYTTKKPLKVLHDVEIRIKRGRFVSIVGPSGSGKSTLLHILALLDRFDSGEYFLDNHNINLMDDKEITGLRREKIGVIFQNFYLFQYFNVFKNVELPLIIRGYPPKERKRMVEEVMEEMGLIDRLKHLPNELSGGEQQRVAIARAIVSEPEILFADEPTGNLDSRRGMKIFEILKRLNKEKGMTILFVTHNLELARLADEIIYLKDGRIVV